MAYDRIEPIGSHETNSILAQLCEMFANVHRDPRKRRRPFEAVEFTSQEKPRVIRRQNPVQMQAMLKSFFMIHNSNAARKGGKK